MNKKILSLLGFAAKAGSLSYGFGAVTDMIKASKAFLVLIAEDISAKSCKEVFYFSNKYNIKAITLNGIDINAVTNAVGRKCGIISVNDKGFAGALNKALIEGGFANDQ